MEIGRAIGWWRAFVGSMIVVTATVVMAASGAAGHWEGAISVGGSDLGILVDLAQDPQGGWQGDIDIPVQAIKDQPLTGLKVDGAKVTFAIAKIPGDPTFNGELSSDGATIKGTFTQNGASFPFQLTRHGDPQSAATAKSPEQLLAGFDKFVDAARQDWKVPGLAVLVIKDDKVVFEQGFGLRDEAGKLPVTPDTQFAIGSSTKAFTATLLATFVEEGKLDWEKPVRDYLNDFVLQDETTTRLMTPRDLVTHVSGLPRHDLVWYGSTLGRRELYDRLRYLAPNTSLRQRWQYNNLMFLTAGVLAERLGNKSWEELVKERLFTPLGIKSANFSVKTMAETSDHAIGYQEKPDGKVEPMPYRTIDAPGPAGSINASVRDMAAWVRFHLGDGKFGENRLLSPAALTALHEPHAVIGKLPDDPEGPYEMYASGWFVQPYRGHDMLHHGGNIDGFSAMVGFMPDDKLGAVVLSNMNGTPLPWIVMLRAFDQLLALDPAPINDRAKVKRGAAKAVSEKSKQDALKEQRKGTKPSHALADYVGTYAHPAYGDLLVTLEKSQLRLGFHSLASRLEHWHYDLFRAKEDQLDGTAVQFRTNVRGDIDAVLLQLEPTVPEVIFSRQAPPEMSEPAYLVRLVGEYQLESGPVVSVSLRGDHLVATVPGQPTYTLVPYRDHQFDLKELNGYSVRFKLAGDIAQAIELVQPEGTLSAKRK